MPDLTGKVAIITGGSAGIGKATAVLFAKLGCQHLTITGRDKAKLEEAKKEIQAAGNLSEKDVLTLTADMSSEKDLENVVHKTVEAFEKIDILVNNAGYAAFENCEDLNMKSLDDMLNMHVRAVAYLTKLTAPHLIKTKGNIVNVSSVNALRPRKNILPYAVAKAAQDHLTRCSALELAAKGVRINSVNPGTTATEIGRSVTNSDEEWNTFLENAKSKHPIGRCGRPVDVANAIAFLASEDASFITATNLSVDGGAAALES